MTYIKPQDRTYNQKQKHAKGICATSFCMKKIEPGRWFCYCCRKYTVRKNHPLAYTFRNLRTNAKRRGKEFTLTLDEFIAFVGKTNYMNKKGTKAKMFQIDRIDETKGYHAWNIQCITLRENVHKYSKFKNSLKEEAGF
jgi:hypothetical protein